MSRRAFAWGRGAGTALGSLLRLSRNALRRGSGPLLSVLLPADCFVCGRPLGPLARLGACSACWAGLTPLPFPVCRSCGCPVPSGTDLLGGARGRCAACLLRPVPLDGVRAAVAYEGAARRILLRAKFERRREILDVLGAQLAAVLSATDFARGSSLVVPVPSHPWIALRRGFNPAAEIARVVARALEIPLRAHLLLRRVRPGVSVKRLGIRSRRTATRSAFRARGSVPGERVLLVDDVMTTGATAEACAGRLREAGAVEVRVAVWARTLRRA